MISQLAGIVSWFSLSFYFLVIRLISSLPLSCISLCVEVLHEAWEEGRGTQHGLYLLYPAVTLVPEDMTDLGFFSSPLWPVQDGSPQLWPLKGPTLPATGYILFWQLPSSPMSGQLFNFP